MQRLGLQIVLLIAQLSHSVEHRRSKNFQQSCLRYCCSSIFVVLIFVLCVTTLNRMPKSDNDRR